MPSISLRGRARLRAIAFASLVLFLLLVPAASAEGWGPYRDLSLTASPSDIAVGSDGTVYVLVSSAHAVRIFGSDGSEHTPISLGNLANDPRGIAVDILHGRLYVGYPDAENSLLLAYGLDGSPQSSETVWLGEPAASFAIDAGARQAYVLTEAGEGYVADLTTVSFLDTLPGTGWRAVSVADGETFLLSPGSTVEVYGTYAGGDLSPLKRTLGAGSDATRIAVAGGYVFTASPAGNLRIQTIAGGSALTLAMNDNAPSGIGAASDLTVYAAHSSSPDHLVQYRYFASDAIESISPSSVPAGSSGSSYTIRGFDFTTATGVEFHAPNAAVYTATTRNVPVSTEINGLFSIPADAYGGAYDVVVRRSSGGDLTLSGGLAVTVTAPTVGSITPDAVRVDSVDATIAGSGFVVPVRAFLNRTGQTSVELAVGSGTTATGVPVTVDPAGLAPGLWDVVVIGANGGKGTLAGGLRVLTNPAVSGIDPSWGRQDRTRPVTIQGSGFASVSGAVLNRSGQTNITLAGLSATATTAAGSFSVPLSAPTGAWNVVVRNGDGPEAVLAGGFEVVAPLNADAPNVSSGRQGTTVPFRLTGENIRGTTGTVVVALERAPTTVTAQLTSVSSTAVEGTFALPSDATLGTYDLRLRDADSAEDLVSGAFEVGRASGVDTVSPNTLPVNRSTVLSITGDGFTGATAVTLTGIGDPIPAAMFTVPSDTSITATFALPSATAPGPRTVEVTLAGGATVSRPNAVAVVSNPVVTSVSPTWGRYVWPSTTFTVTGHDLGGVTRVVMSRAGCDNITSTGVTPSENTVAAEIRMFVAPYDPRILGRWNATVVTSDGPEATLVGAFELVEVPRVTSSNVTSGRRGTTVPFRLGGTDFMGTPASLGVNLSWTTGTPVKIPARVVSVSRTAIEGTFTLPSDAPLHGYEIVVRDVDGLDFGYNTPFSLLEASSIATATPPYLRRDSVPATLTIGGVGLTGATAVRLRGGGGPELVNLSPRVVNDSAVEATFSAQADTPLGDRDIAITLPGGAEAVRTGGLTIIANPRSTGMNVTDAVTGDTAFALAIEGTDLVPGQLELRDGPTPVMLPGLASLADGDLVWTGTLAGVPPGTYTLRVHGPHPLEYAVPTRLTVHPSEVRARIVADRLAGTPPLAVSFTGDVTGYADRFAWSFGDGSPYAYTQSTTHTYTTPGTYRVQFAALNSVEANSTWTEVVVSSGLQASFSAYPQSGPAPLQVRFLDYSTGSPTSWSWSFGDGATSTDREPTHVYAAPGIYTPTLTVTDATGASSRRSLDQGVVVTGTVTLIPTITTTPTGNVTVTPTITVTSTVNVTATPTITATPTVTVTSNVTASPTVTAGPGPYPAPHVAPCRIEAEDYDLGGYSDTTPGNEGGAYRQDDVDIETAYGITNVGWIRPGEWLVYSVDVPDAGAYALTLRTANPGAAKPVAVLVDDVPVVSVTVPGTGSFGRFADTVSPSFSLVPGRHRVRLAFVSSGSINLDSLDVRRAGGPTPTLTVLPTPPAGGASFAATPLSAPRGSRVKFTLTPAAGRTVKAVWWSFDSPAHLNTWNSRVASPSFYYPARGTFSPFVRITYTDNTQEVVHRPGYIRAT